VGRFVLEHCLAAYFLWQQLHIENLGGERGGKEEEEEVVEIRGEEGAVQYWSGLCCRP
jgi:hypothetical protein